MIMEVMIRSYNHMKRRVDKPVMNGEKKPITGMTEKGGRLRTVEDKGPK